MGGDTYSPLPTLLLASTSHQDQRQPQGSLERQRLKDARAHSDLSQASVFLRQLLKYDACHILRQVTI